ncbi:MAG: metal ABC transporter solute-binding protein, Zn/Mn family, partial [Alkalispirochaeta sp.]
LDTVETAATGYIVPVSAGIEATGDHDHDDDDHDHGEDDHDHDDDDHDHGEDDHDHDHAAGDPHVWFDPNNVTVWVENIEHVMSDLLPGEHEAFEAAAERYEEQLQELDAEIRRRVASLPESRRKIVIDHASLDYFADRYGFEVIGTVIPATTDQAEPSTQAVARLVEVIRQEEAPAIFVGATASRGLEGLVNAVAGEVGRDIRIGRLLTGSLAPEGEPGDTYLGFMEYNVTQIVENLAD